VLLFIIILTQGVLFLYLLSHMYCNSIKIKKVYIILKNLLN